MTVSVLKGLFITLLILALIAGGILWFFRFDIFQLSAETVIKKLLPDYVHVDRIVFDLENGSMVVEGFAIKNPEGYHNRYLATIDTISCRYRMRGKNILDGIEVTEIEAVTPHINIERAQSGKLNVNDMGAVMGAAGDTAPARAQEPSAVSSLKERFDPGRITGKRLSDVVKLTDTINIRNGKVTFLDKVVSSQGYLLTFEDFNGNIVLDLGPEYSFVRSVGTQGYGFVNGNSGERVEWRVTWQPLADRLTLSSRFTLTMVDLIPFKPYYDRYAPIDILRGRASGTLVFDFDNGNIGSTDEIKLSGLKFRQKSEGTASRFWAVTTSDIIKYLESSPGEIMFDFRIKGDMDQPQIYPGPYVKQAIQMMAIDTISDLVYGPQQPPAAPAPGAQTAPVPAAPKSDAEKVVDIIRELMKK